MTNKKNPSSYPHTRELLAWYALNRRDLPWRKTRDPYPIWVSEIMLQQTQVETVIPYYCRFIARFPSVNALAAASMDQVLKAWENMGYYARARHLHAAAKELVKGYGGKIPDNAEALRALPGIGEYTAGAILSIAFDRPFPAVDGNVRRIITRLFAIDTPLHQNRTERRIKEKAVEIVPPKGAGLFNQALMDLGATLCRARKPACMDCPLKDGCQAHRLQMQDALPVTRKRGPIPHHHVTAGVIRDADRRILIVRRPGKGLLGGLWNLPGGRRLSGERLETCLRREVLETLGIRIRVKKPITSVNHAYTHFRITLHAFLCQLGDGEPKTIGCDDWRWTTLGGSKDFAFSKADRKIMAFLES